MVNLNQVTTINHQSAENPVQVIMYVVMATIVMTTVAVTQFMTVTLSTG